MSDTQNIKKDYFWNTLGVLAQNALSPLLLVVVTRINGIEDSGVFSFAFAMAVIFWSISMWGGRIYQVSDAQAKFQSVSYIIVRMLLAVVVLLASILFVVTNGYNTTKSLVLVALVLMKVIESIADAAYGVMQVKDRLYISGISLTMKSVLGIAAFIAIDFLSGSLFASCLSLVAVNVAILLGFDLPFAARLEELRIKTKHRRIQLKRALQIIKASTPVFAATFLSMFSLNIPRYFLDRYHTEDVALYGIFAMPITVIVLLVSFILQPNIVGLSKLYAQKKYELYDKSIRKIVVLSLAIGAGAVFATVLFGEWAVRIIFNVPIENQTISLNVMVVGAVFNAIVAIFTVIMTIMRRFKHQVYILLISNLLLALIGVIIGQRINLSVAAILFSITNIVQAVVMALTYQLTKRRHV